VRVERAHGVSYASEKEKPHRGRPRLRDHGQHHQSRNGTAEFGGCNEGKRFGCELASGWKFTLHGRAALCIARVGRASKTSPGEQYAGFTHSHNEAAASA
jgi:hypothetical protein